MFPYIFAILQCFSKFIMFSKPKTGPRKRAYRWYRVKCNECQKEMDADHANTHMKNVHSGKEVKLTPLVETSQSQIHGFFVSGNESNESGVRRVKTYLRSTMGQDRLSSIALLAMERVYTNRTIENDIEKIIDVFGGCSHRTSQFF